MGRGDSVLYHQISEFAIEPASVAICGSGFNLFDATLQFIAETLRAVLSASAAGATRAAAIDVNHETVVMLWAEPIDAHCVFLIVRRVRHASS